MVKISIFGSGYVGLITSVCFAELGHQIICADINKAKVRLLQSGQSPIYDPRLDELLKKHLTLNRLSFTYDIEKAVEQSDVLFIAVGTPADPQGNADLRDVQSIAHTIGQVMTSSKLVVLKSTAPVGTTEQIYKLILDELKIRNQIISVDVCSNPEFIREGNGIYDFFSADRIIIGTNSPGVKKMMRKCYSFTPLYPEPPLLFMSIRAAEFSKYAANAMLATRISFINEMANIAEQLGVDVDEMCQGIGSDHRIGHEFLHPGCGYGGSCLPKDVQALIQQAAQYGYFPQLIKATHEVNERQKTILFDKLKFLLGDCIEGVTVALWGLSFKPDTNDMRKASSCTFINAALDAGLKIRAYDPAAMEEALCLYGANTNLYFALSLEDSLLCADVLVICTEWSMFQEVDLEWIKAKLTYPIIIDGRNLFDPHLMSQKGILYWGVGKKNWSLDKLQEKNKIDLIFRSNVAKSQVSNV